MEIFFLGGVFVILLIIDALLDRGGRRVRSRSKIDIKLDSETKGILGENEIYRLLLAQGVPSERILRNLYIPKGKNGETSEVDMAIVSRKGVFVIECKNYFGKVYGDMRYKNWKYYLGNKEKKFYNPILQNRTHVKVIKRVLDDAEIPVVPFTIVMRRMNWKVSGVKTKDHFIGVNEFWGEYENLKESEHMIQHENEIFGKLQKFCNADEETKKKHVLNIQNRFC